MKRPVVVKLGSSLVAGPGGRARAGLLAARSAEIGDLVRAGTPVCVVSSGAIALGLHRLGLDRRPRALPALQAASALGQARLQGAWDKALRGEGLLGAQILLTAAEVADRAAYLNVRNTLSELSRRGAVPIVNENDATATDEIAFGDNDALAAIVAVLTGASLLVLLTEVDGVYTRRPGTPGAEPIADGSGVGSAALGEGSTLGRGGMRSKILAAELAASAAIPTVIAAGRGQHVLGPIVAGEPRGTRFAPSADAPSAFKLWLRLGKRVEGRLHVDAGAHAAVGAEGRSLLAVGVVRCEGRFAAGDGVELVAPDGAAFAKGVASAAAADIATRARGLEAVHRNRLVLL